MDKAIKVIRDGERAEFFYDGQGMLAGKRVNGEYEAWTWDGLALIARGDERYVNEGHISGGIPVLSRSREGVRYHQTDILGTTLATYTVDGKMEPVLASAFGAEMGAGSLSGTRRFTGKPYDRHLGAHVFPYRNYDATVARWRSSDPAGFPDGPNGHFYAPVPTMGLDPLGLLKWDTLAQSLDSHGNPITDPFNRPEGGVYYMEVWTISTDDGNNTVTLHKNVNGDDRYYSNCHGYTFAGGNYWIEPTEVVSILNGDGWKRVFTEYGDSVSSPAIALYNGSEHSAKVTKISNGTPTEVRGISGLAVYPVSTPPNEQWGSVNPYYYEK